MYLTYHVHLVGIKKKKLTARMHGVESFKIENINVYYGEIIFCTL